MAGNRLGPKASGLVLAQFEDPFRIASASIG